MLRFHESEQVLVHRLGQEILDQPSRGTVCKVYGDRESFIFDYMVQLPGRRVTVKDAWLAPYDLLIRETPDLVDLLSE